MLTPSVSLFGTVFVQLCLRGLHLQKSFVQWSCDMADLVFALKMGTPAAGMHQGDHQNAGMSMIHYILWSYNWLGGLARKFKCNYRRNYFYISTMKLRYSDLSCMRSPSCICWGPAGVGIKCHGGEMKDLFSQTFLHKCFPNRK